MSAARNHVVADIYNVAAWRRPERKNKERRFQMHNEYWINVKRDAEKRICALFDDCKTEVEDIIGHGMDEGLNLHDAKKMLAYVLKHGDYTERACAIISFSEWTHAVHELNERGPAGAGLAG